MLHVGMADPFQARGLDTLRQAQKRRLHILRQSGDLGVHDGAKGFDGPGHRAVGLAVGCSFLRK